MRQIAACELYGCGLPNGGLARQTVVMQPRKCPECGARLPSAPGRHVCVYGQHEVVVPEARPRPAAGPPGAAAGAPDAATARAAVRSVGAIAGAVALLSLVIGGAVIWQTTRSIGGAFATGAAALGGNASGVAAWDGKTSFECAGNQQLVIEDQKAELSGTVVIASGNCHLRIVRCTLKGDTAIEAAGNARVVVEGGAVEGRHLA